MKKVLIVLLMLGVAFCAFATGQAEQVKPAEPLTLATVIRSVSNPYHQDVIKGAELFAATRGFKHEVLKYEGSSEKQMNDIKAWIAKTRGNIVFVVDPNQKTDLYAIAKEMEKEKIYWVSIWEKPEDMKVSDYQYWVSAITFDNVEAGYKTGKALFDGIGGQGQVFAIQGTQGHSAAITRWEGFQQALKEYPRIELVGWEDGEWQKAKGYTLTSNALAAHPDIKGIWGANDNMVSGAIEALRSRNLIGSVKVAGINAIPELVMAVKSGEAAATFSSDPYWQNGMAFSMCVAAREGRLKLAEQPEEKRAWVATSILVDPGNVDWYIKSYIEGTPGYDWNDFYGHWIRAMK